MRAVTLARARRDKFLQNQAARAFENHQEKSFDIGLADFEYVQNARDSYTSEYYTYKMSPGDSIALGAFDESSCKVAFSGLRGEETSSFALEYIYHRAEESSDPPIAIGVGFWLLRKIKLEKRDRFFHCFCSWT